MSNKIHQGGFENRVLEDTCVSLGAKLTIEISPQSAEHCSRHSLAHHSLIQKLHWLKNYERIEVKVILQVYKCQSNERPAYLTRDLVPFARLPEVQTEVS